MKNQINILTATLCLLAFACKNKPQTGTQITDTVIKSTTAQVQTATTKPEHTDTLQFLYFDGNGDYWQAYFMNARKDTVNMITEDDGLDKLSNHILEVKWRPDTFEEAGDDGKFEAKHLIRFKEVPGQLFEKPKQEEEIINDIANLPEVKEKAAKVKIAKKPTETMSPYLIEACTENNGSFAPLFTFRVYRYPFYEIKYYDTTKEEEVSLAEWRKPSQ
ncbi:hypothetical protein KHS38_18990 [Mucilaginibacter sp. Bleaf8]|uniref:hypothetical protein n=1 Tax=Mucilaginibacter sp. Bleaf8 TaxID=2834430 RepID=UPI001BD17DF2|nr:hypothetical protein [Mucilaginibacter sp. Bleaf8]MBS7566499.1 hypothetical protein [Mucilaginibacter sp. Bleaf8]